MQNTLQLFLTWKEQFFGKITSKLKGVQTLKYVPSEYTCKYCEKSKPLTLEHYQQVKTFKYGFSTVCNECNKSKPKKISK